MKYRPELQAIKVNRDARKNGREKNNKLEKLSVEFIDINVLNGWTKLAVTIFWLPWSVMGLVNETRSRRAG